MTNKISRLKIILWKKWKFLLLSVAIIFLLIQLCNISILGFVGDSSRKVPSELKELNNSKLMKKLEENNISLFKARDSRNKYFSISKGKFICFGTKEELEYIKINDDYCDCTQDGSDEPKTNACNNGVFYCKKSSRNSAVKIPSYQVNDGVCDCCDGSDEWLEVFVVEANNVSGDSLLKYHPIHCINQC